MARGPRVVAELGRPETPGETAARKAESSRVYRSSQTFRHLIAALLVTVGVVAVIIFGVPRGEVAERPAIDVETLAAEASAAYDRDIVVADVPEDWRVNAASIDASSGAPAWTTVYAPESEGGFVRIAQGFDTDDAWARTLLRGAAPLETEMIAGREWTAFRFSTAEASGNVTYALATQAGRDHIVIYGSVAPDTAKAVADGLEPQLRILETDNG